MSKPVREILAEYWGPLDTFDALCLLTEASDRIQRMSPERFNSFIGYDQIFLDNLRSSNPLSLALVGYEIFREFLETHGTGDGFNATCLRNQIPQEIMVAGLLTMPSALLKERVFNCS